MREGILNPPKKKARPEPHSLLPFVCMGIQLDNSHLERNLVVAS